jgi:hypothetical protein
MWSQEGPQEPRLKVVESIGKLIKPGQFVIKREKQA